MVEGFIQGYYAILNSVFAPLFSLDPAISVLILCVLVMFILTASKRLIVNQGVLRDIKAQIKEKQKKMKEIKDNEEERKKVMNEVMSLSNKQMKMNMKPMIISLLIVALILPWMAITFTGPVVDVPFVWPFSNANYMGWLGWYFILSMPLVQIFNKILGVET